MDCRKEVAKKKMETSREIKRGQVYYVRYDDSIGDEMAVGRAVLIVSNNGDIEEMNTVITVFMTTGARKSKNVVTIRFNGKTQHIHCSQLRTFDKSRLGNYIGELDDESMRKVDNMLALAMSYNRPLEEKVTVTGDGLEMELVKYKKLYERALDEIVEMKFQKDTNIIVEEKVIEVPVEKVVEKIVEKPVVVKETVEKIVEVPRELTEDEILEYIDKMFGDEPPIEEAPAIEEVSVEEPVVEEASPKKKSGRPKQHGMGCNPTRDQLEQFKKEGKVNINKDDWWVIAATTGMSMNAARRIVRTRNQIGRFRTLKDLMKVDFVKASFIEKYGPMMEV